MPLVLTNADLIDAVNPNVATDATVVIDEWSHRRNRPRPVFVVRQ